MMMKSRFLTGQPITSGPVRRKFAKSLLAPRQVPQPFADNAREILGSPVEVKL
ncbi:hypothetical protein DEV91_11824 [Phyllobacterium brassicacearum]|nr:hypothetical protein DEV91_11824 [Phyllobacterium brassicacearum]